MARKAKNKTLPAKPAASSAQVIERCLPDAESAPVSAACAECGRSPAEVIRSLEAQLETARRERKELEQSYTKNREIYSLAIEATNLGIYDTKVKDEDLALKENWLARLGYDPKLASDSQLTWERLIHPDDFEQVTALYRQLEEGRVPSLNMEYRILAASGEWRWIIESAKLIADVGIDGGTRIVGTHFDITERKRIEEAERKQRAFAEALSASASIFNSTLNLNELLNLILVNVGKVVPLDDSDIWLIDENKKSVHPAYRKGNVNRVLPIYSVEFLIEEIPVFKEVARHRKPLYLSDIQLNQTPIPTRNPDQRSCVVTPICFASHLLGFLVVYSLEKRCYTPLQIEHLQAFANQAATAIRNAHLYTRAQEMAALDERQRLAREMHDVISQTLFSATIKAETLPLMLASEPPEVIEANLRELHKLTRGALAEMRTMLMELRPNAMINTEPSNLLQQMVDGLAGRTTAEIKFTSQGYGLLPPEVQTVFFRIAQEAINNLVKHSKARKVAIHFQNSDDRVTLRIADDGCGFNPGHIPSERMGLRIMRERAESVGAALTIDSQPAAGTCIELHWARS